MQMFQKCSNLRKIIWFQFNMNMNNQGENTSKIYISKYASKNSTNLYIDRGVF